MAKLTKGIERKVTKRIFDMDAYDKDVEAGMDPKEAKEKQIEIMNK